MSTVNIGLTTLTLLLTLTGCANTSSPEADAAKIENKKTLIEAAIQPGKDRRCISILGFEGCYERERTVSE